MIVSKSEIETTLRSAAVGSGWPFGLAEDIGRAAAWLVLHDLDGVGAALAAIEAGPTAPQPAERTADGWLLYGTQGPAAAISALDLALSAEAEERIRLKSCSHPLLLVGVAGSAAKAFECGFALGFGAGAEAGVLADGLQLKGDLPTGPCDVAITHQPPGRKRDCSAEVGLLNVEDAAWRAAKALAAKTYVPASEASRAHGAGAGLLDND